MAKPQKIRRESMKRIAIYSEYFDPPTLHNQVVVQELQKRFDLVIVIPHGRRQDFSTMTDSGILHRAAMIDLAFSGMERVAGELGNLEQQEYATAYDQEMQFESESQAQIFHVVDARDILRQPNGRSKIQNDWLRGDELWERSHFLIMCDQGQKCEESCLPRYAEQLHLPHHLDSESIRSFIYHNDNVSSYLHPAIEQYIRRHGLYRGTPALREMQFKIDNPPRFQFYADEKNQESQRIRALLRKYESPNPEVIITIGGDGTMLRAIREHWRKRLPIFGLNTGHLGFLLNDKNNLDFWQEKLLLYQLPLLWVETIGLGGRRREGLAFNDTWVERATGQTAWVEVRVDGQVRLPKVVGDGMLISTAAGSTSYARAMGAFPMPFNTPVLIMVGSNVLNPPFWRPAILPLESEVELTTLDPEKRPLQCYIDGDSQGLVRSVKIRMSRIASVELAFTHSHHPAHKLAMQQFPAS